MDGQNLLFSGKGGARASDPRTSHQAATKFQSGRVTAKMRLLAAYEQRGSMSDEDAGSHADVKTAHKRISELVREGYLKKVGEERGPYGTDVRICGLTQDGEELADRLSVCLSTKIETKENQLAQALDLITRMVDRFGVLLDGIAQEVRDHKGEITLKEWSETQSKDLENLSSLLDCCLVHIHREGQP